MPIHPVVQRVTERIKNRSGRSRAAYLERLHQARAAGTQRARVSCTNLAHAMAAVPANDKLAIRAQKVPNIAIVSAYNDMLSAHQPFASFPEIIKQAAREAGGTAQYAGGVPAMCDGVTQGQPGMELSLWSRDVIAQATAVALSHAVFDGALLLGVCDKIVPGLLIGALAFGHLPMVFVPAGPMTTGLSNDDKAKTRQLYAQGKLDRQGLLEAEMKSYHGPGTCTFYGTANSNQVLMEAMGLHLPGSAFINPGTALRDALTAQAARHVVAMSASTQAKSIGEIVDERALVNAIVALLASGGSTNHTIHLVAIASAAGVHIDWDDFNDLSAVVPLIARVYPNGSADINHFHAAGGVGFLLSELLHGGFLHEDVNTVLGSGLAAYTQEPHLDGTQLLWQDAPSTSLDLDVLRPAQQPFQPEGGLRLLDGNLGRAVFKASAVKPEHRVVQAPAAVFDDQESMLAAFKAGELERDVVVVVRFQGPRANGMPELHQLTPSLAVLQDKGFKVALVTDGRMSGASGKVPAAIHLSPEASRGGLLAKIRHGDLIRLDANAGVLQLLLDPSELEQRSAASFNPERNAYGYGRDLFASYRQTCLSAEQGAATWYGASNE